MIKFSRKSEERLKGLHPDLVKVVRRAAQISDLDFTVLEGMRTLERQRELVKKGASQTMNSRHLTGHAVDLAPLSKGVVTWEWPLYYKLEKIMKQAAKDVKVDIEWGGDWKKFKDGPHWQLPFNKYPKGKSFVTAAVESDKPITNETENQAKTKAVATIATGTVSSTGVAYEPVIKGVEILTSQQGEFSSGDWLRVGLALVIVVGTVWLAWKKLK